MNTIKGYLVRMWTSDRNIHSQKFFSSEQMLEARRASFEYAHNLLDIMEEAKKQGVISYNNPEEILDPEVRIEDVEVLEMGVAEALGLLAEGSIQDVKTILLLQYLQLHGLV